MDSLAAELIPNELLGVPYGKHVLRLEPFVDFGIAFAYNVAVGFGAAVCFDVALFKDDHQVFGFIRIIVSHNAQISLGLYEALQATLISVHIFL